MEKKYPDCKAVGEKKNASLQNRLERKHRC